MDETMMRTISKDLDALVNEFGIDENGNNKVMIPSSRDRAMRFIKEWAYESKGNFWSLRGASSSIRSNRCASLPGKQDLVPVDSNSGVSSVLESSGQHR